mmetsp:Transcript_93325/g.216981  ORF Transcript_93325/g.216981 Transcript_93325/m.216981 type:complete len:467 (+) Transcript_93325:116-1516(+)
MKKRSNAAAAVPAVASKRELGDLECQVPHLNDSNTCWLNVGLRPRLCFSACLVCCGLTATVALRTPRDAAVTSLKEVVAPTVTLQRAYEINELLKDKPVDEVLQWVSTAMPAQVVQFTSFGPSGLVILDHLSSLDLLAKQPTVMVDTLHLFPETYALIKNLSEKYPSLDLRVYYPHGFHAGEKDAFNAKYGAKLWSQDYSRYAYLSKVEPTERALDDLKVQAWITGRRRSQGGERESLEVIEWDKGRLKVNPLANWTLGQVWEYIRSHNVPYNPLHDRGYTSVGDVMTTRAVSKGESERAGRFDGVNRTECGMHKHAAKIESMREEAAEHGVPFEIPNLPCSSCLDVRPGTFWDAVLDTKHDMLVEFYSPFCGHCHDAAPKYEEVGKRVREVAPDFGLARMDIISYDIPLVGQDAGFVLEAYPTIFLVRPGSVPGKPLVQRYTGKKEVRPLLEWLKQKLEYLPRSL